MTSRLAIMMGGRVAEELIFGKDKVTSGASSDIQPGHRASPATWSPAGAISDALGIGRLRREPGRGVPRPLGGAHPERLGGHRPEDRRRGQRLVQGGYDEARRILTERLEDLHTLAKALLEYETLSGEEIIGVLKGIPPRPRRARGQAPAAARRSSVPLTPRPPAATRSRQRGAQPERRRERWTRTARCVMGVVNVTPDSFSDGGRFFDEAAAVAHAPPADRRGRRHPRHRRRVHPAGRRAGRRGRGDRPGRPGDRARSARESAVPISIDTMKPAVARAAVARRRDDVERRHRAALVAPTAWRPPPSSAARWC